MRDVGRVGFGGNILFKYMELGFTGRRRKTSYFFHPSFSSHHYKNVRGGDVLSG